MLGKAMDTTMPGFPMERIREAGMKLEHGGVGWYPSSNFVHLDVGGIRSWPRMSYDQLSSLFPDGKTVHIAADGRTLPGYDQARVELAERGGEAELPPAQTSGGFFAWLFGTGSNSAAREDEEDRRAPTEAAPAPVAVAAAPQMPATAPEPLRVQSPQVSGTQVASLEASAVGAPAALPAPLPPPRPAELAFADVPLPPTRPDTLDRTRTASIRYSDSANTRSDPIGALVTATASGLPAMRRSSLPTIITQGGSRAVPDEALAFAPNDTAVDLEPVPMPVARPADLPKPLALRSAHHRAPGKATPLVATVQTQVADAAGGPSGLAGPRLTGLRKAARLMDDASL
jgi:hypothetical protein